MGIAIGLTVEVIKSAVPYLPIIWLAVLVHYTWEGITYEPILSFASKQKNRLSGRRCMFSYGIVAMLGAALLVFYWWGLNSFFAPKIAKYQAELHRQGTQTSPKEEITPTPPREEPKLNLPAPVKPRPPAAKDGLSLSIDSIVVSDTVAIVQMPTPNALPVAPPGAPKVSGVSALIIATVTNTGNPSIADTWHLTVKAPSGQTYESTPEIISLPVGAGGSGADDPKILIHPSEALYRKTAPNPLATGSKTQGILIFKITGDAPKTSVMAVGNVFTLSCKDVYGNQIRATHTIKGLKNSGSLAYPGILP